MAITHESHTPSLAPQLSCNPDVPPYFPTTLGLQFASPQHLFPVPQHDIGGCLLPLTSHRTTRCSQILIANVLPPSWKVPHKRAFLVCLLPRSPDHPGVRNVSRVGASWTPVSGGLSVDDVIVALDGETRGRAHGAGAGGAGADRVEVTRHVVAVDLAVLVILVVPGGHHGQQQQRPDRQHDDALLPVLRGGGAEVEGAERHFHRLGVGVVGAAESDVDGREVAGGRTRREEALGVGAVLPVHHLLHATASDASVLIGRPAVGCLVELDADMGECEGVPAVAVVHIVPIVDAAHLLVGADDSLLHQRQRSDGEGRGFFSRHLRAHLEQVFRPCPGGVVPLAVRL
mmetsp:Transcript_69005/g.143896  ORF Transcript_69005/g.143896 Transcript_69005/m.143896 type:complete len:344 (+) Transcript_69005:55-1086(+)